MMPLNLRAAEPMFHERAREALRDGDAGGFLFCAKGNTATLALVFDNAFALVERGIFEEALIDAFAASRTNNHHFTQGCLDFLFACANRQKTLALGAPVPPGPITLYRGVAGIGRSRRIRGWSWTDSLPVACWFAQRFYLQSPAVHVATIAADDVYCHYKERGESEYICRPSTTKKMQLSHEELIRLADEHAKRIKAQNAETMKELAGATYPH